LTQDNAARSASGGGGHHELHGSSQDKPPDKRRHETASFRLNSDFVPAIDIRRLTADRAAGVCKVSRSFTVAFPLSWNEKQNRITENPHRCTEIVSFTVAWQQDHCQHETQHKYLLSRLREAVLRIMTITY
jgi:hypothetical protein